MVEELHNKERLEGILRILPHNPELAEQLIQFMIDEIDLKVEQFEKEYAWTISYKWATRMVPQTAGNI